MEVELLKDYIWTYWKQKIVNYYDSFKKETRKYTVSNSKQNPMTHLKIMLDSDKEFLETIFSKMNSGKTKYSLKELSSRADFFRTRIQKIEKLIKELEDQK